MALRHDHQTESKANKPLFGCLQVYKSRHSHAIDT